MNRYYLYKYITNKDDHNILLDADMKLDDTGNFVLYEDHIKEIEAVKNRVCEWKLLDGYMMYITDCNQVIDGYNYNQPHNRHPYCKYCGGKIEIKSEGK